MKPPKATLYLLAALALGIGFIAAVGAPEEQTQGDFGLHVDQFLLD